MQIYRSFEIKWYHLLFGLLGVLAVVFVLLWLFVGKSRVRNFFEDETDIVA